MGLFKKKETTKLTSDEFEILNNKIVSIIGDIAIANNSNSILYGNWRKLSAKVAVLNKEATKEEAESDLKSLPVHI